MRNKSFGRNGKYMSTEEKIATIRFTWRPVYMENYLIKYEDAFYVI